MSLIADKITGLFTSPCNGEDARASWRRNWEKVSSIVFNGITAFNFLFFLLLCIRLVFVYLYNAPQSYFYIGCVGAIAVLVVVFFNTTLSFMIFIACIPLAGGLFSCGILPFSPLNFGFAVLFIAWFLKNIKNLRRLCCMNVKPPLLGRLVDTLSFIAILSLVVTLFRYPWDYLLYNLTTYPNALRNDDFFILTATFVMVEGLMLYRMFTLDDVLARHSNSFRKLVYVQAGIIIFFIGLQFLFHYPPMYSQFYGLYSPFTDIHSFGSITLFYFFTLLISVSKMDDRVQQFLGVSALAVLFIALIFSYSRATWIAFAIFIAVLIFRGLRHKGAIAVCAAVLLGVVLIINAYPSRLLKSENVNVRRFGSAMVVSSLLEDRNVLGRLFWIDRALRIVADYPITGIGLGRYYGNPSQFREFSDALTRRMEKRVTGPAVKEMKKRRENVHNYYVQLAAELGIPAVVIFCAIIVAVFLQGRTLIRNNVHKNFFKGTLVGLGVYLFTMLSMQPLYLPDQSLLFCFFLALISMSHKKFTPQAACRSL
ncbi:MAG: O-antigen ligase family protein [Deltaproteobacteria bacterium]|nr:O-antigen ligase family protein [Deltaproteobacteria bacterium]